MRNIYRFSLACGLLLASCNSTKVVDRSCPLGYEKTYQVQMIDSSTWLINESGIATAYLVAGTEKAALIDAGIGIGDIKELAGSLTTLPVEMYNTHGHSDHIGADYLFDEVYMSLADTIIYNRFFDPKTRLQLMKNILLDNKQYNITEENMERLANIPPAKVKDVKEGDVFDLGDRKLEVVAVPGHTAGSVIFLDRAHKYVFTGDAINSHLWMWLEESLSLDVYDDAISRIRPMLNVFERIYNGHESSINGMPISHVDSIMSHINVIKEGSCQADTVEVYGQRVPVYIFGNWRILLKR